MINFSIIIPHKNIPDLLERCLKSIPQRDDLQVIVVDDDSEIPPRHCGNDGRVEFIFAKDEKRSGAGFARNIGLEHAKGRWIIFADADDFFSYAINDVLDEYKDNPADIVFFKNTCVDTVLYTSAGNQPWRAARNGYIDLYDTKPARAETLLRYCAGMPWGKLIKRALVEAHTIRFDEIKCWNDIAFSYLSGFYARHIAWDKRALYTVTVRTGSLQESGMNLEKQLAALYAYGKLMMFYKEKKINFSWHLHIRELVKIFFFDHSNYPRAKHILYELGYSNRDILLQVLCMFIRYIIKLPLFLIRKLIEA